MDKPLVAATAPAESIEGRTEAAGQEVFNPFGTIGIAVQKPVPLVPQPVEADWTLPMGVAICGFGFICWLLRKMAG